MSSSKGSFSSVEQSSGTEKMRLGEVVDLVLDGIVSSQAEYMIKGVCLRSSTKVDPNFDFRWLKRALVSVNSHAKDQFVACSQSSSFLKTELLAIDVRAVHGIDILDVNIL